MRPTFCTTCLVSLLKLLSFLQAFIGVSVVVYSLFVWNRWHRRHGVAEGWGFDLGDLPAPWFVCLLMGIGVLMCLIAFSGHVAAEAANGCCLCFYVLLALIFILLEVVSIVFLVIDKQWQEDLPKDTTGELRKLRAFIEANIDICKWVGVAVILIQVLSLLLAFFLRAIVPSRSVDYDSDSDFAIIRQPLLNSQFAPNPILTSLDGKGTHSDIWSARMRQKYGLQQGEFSYNAVDLNASPL